MKKGKTGEVIAKHVWKVVDQFATNGILVSIEHPTKVEHSDEGCLDVVANIPPR